MNKNEFFNTLMDGLKDIPETKLQTIIHYYQMYFNNNLKKGKTEDDILIELGDPLLIINNIKNDKLAYLLKSYSYYNINKHRNSVKNYLTFNLNLKLVFKIFIMFLSLIIISSIIIEIINLIAFGLGFTLMIFLSSICILIDGTFTNLVDIIHATEFISHFPYTAVVLFSLGSIFLSIFLFILFYYIIKLFIIILVRIYNSLKFLGDQN